MMRKDIHPTTLAMIIAMGSASTPASRPMASIHTIWECISPPSNNVGIMAAADTAEARASPTATYPVAFLDALPTAGIIRAATKGSIHTAQASSCIMCAAPPPCTV